MGVAKLTASSDELEVVMFDGKDEVPATVTIKGIEPKPEIPDEGIHGRITGIFLGVFFQTAFSS